MSYKRIVLKISGEALAAEKKTGFDFDFVSSVCSAVKKAADAGVQVGIVIGGGNFWRGVKDGAGKVERVSADRMGMLATCMNCLAVCDVFRQLGAKARVLTAVDIQGVGERYDTRRALEYLENGEIVLFAGGTGMPFFSTDTGAVLRAAEIHADAILLAKNIDGVYSADPRKDPAWIPRPRPSRWTTPSRCSSSRCRAKTSCARWTARRSGPWYSERKPHGSLRFLTKYR